MRVKVDESYTVVIIHEYANTPGRPWATFPKIFSTSLRILTKIRPWDIIGINIKFR